MSKIGEIGGIAKPEKLPTVERWIPEAGVMVARLVDGTQVRILAKSETDAQTQLTRAQAAADAQAEAEAAGEQERIRGEIETHATRIVELSAKLEDGAAKSAIADKAGGIKSSLSEIGRVEIGGRA